MTESNRYPRVVRSVPVLDSPTNRTYSLWLRQDKLDSEENKNDDSAKNCIK